MELEGRLFEAGLGEMGGDLLDQCLRSVELMRLGLTRCAMVSIPGGWDSHGDNSVQAPQFDDLFAALDELMDYLYRTPGYHARWLIDEVVVVCLSEIGRTPLLNGSGGKDHWPFTSALVAGAGVRGGRTLGATDGGLIGLPIDLSTGAASAGGDALGCESVGCALLALAGLAPSDFLPGVPSLDALVRG